MKNQLIFLLFVGSLFVGCKTYTAKPYDFPNKVDTTDKPIELQEKKTYSVQNVSADNLFDGARLNNFEHVNENHFRATISPENAPINHSPYYAFRLKSETEKTIKLELNYTLHRHRYWPKISTDGENWEWLDSSRFQIAADTVNAFLTLDIGPNVLWVAGQEVQNSKHIQEWSEQAAQNKDARLSSIGKSKMGKDLWFLDIHDGDFKKEDVIVIMTRQHPPEVTGWFAMREFVNEILADNQLSNDFRKKYRIMVFPLMNPDGVDLGHWRHNAGGIDLNRDWAYYHQPEARTVANFVVEQSKRSRSDVILGLDFHSTFWDVYYTNKETTEHIPHFKDYWLHGIHNAFGEDINEKPSNIGGPVSKNWVLTQFNAPGITYEIGDNTPRDYIKVKGKVTAVEMMQLLVLR